MSYQKVIQPQFFYENPGYFEEAESFIDTVSYSESDGFIGFPMVRSVPSYDIQELYIKKPVRTTSSRILPVSQRSRRYLGGQNEFYPEYICQLQPRVPPHLKYPQGVNSIQSSLRLPKKSSADKTQRIGPTGIQQRTSKTKSNGTFFKSSPYFSSGQNIHVSDDAAEEYPRYYHTRRGRASTPMPRRDLSCFSEPFTNLQCRDQELSSQTQYSREFSRPQEIGMLQKDHTNTFKCMSHCGISAEEELKKPNSEGDATGYASTNELDNIGRIATTLDVDEAGKLSDKQRMEIKEMSKFLIPRVPSSIRSLQEPTGTKQKGLIPKNEETVQNNTENKKEFRLSFRKSLDSVLNQLESCETSLNAVKSKFSMNKSEPQTSKKTTMRANSKEDIFNLREIYSKLNKTNEEKKHENEEDAVKPVVDSVDIIEEKIANCSRPARSRGTLDDPSAIELHRSKSYIVNLIDRALSKELGTSTNGDSERFQDLNPVEVIERIERNRRMKYFDKAGTSVLRQDCESSSHLKEESHTYIEQLKELRWGHFKHIQQEVKRLEELERFLDHCGTSDKRSV